ncbi:type II CAAX prenyl endopeptidase Rce1 family protein [Paenibacillus chitinolyticus]|uniref:CPBP family glutamic-type intramembrane protease n=1 Tax=Paenibacillus chitinolyticus TaxID=79263 RepID=UPI0035DC62CA
MKKNQWILYLLLVFLLVLETILKPTKEMFFLLLLTQIQIFINFNAFRIQDKAFKGADWIRRSLYFIPYLLGIFFGSINTTSPQHLVLAVPLALLTGTAFLGLRMNEIKPFYNKELVAFFPPVKLNKALLEFYSYTSSAILQEFYFKAFVISALTPLFGVPIALLTSSILFVSDHLLHARSCMFKKSDYFAQLAMSLCTGMLYVLSGSAWIAVLAHFTFNTPLAFSYLFRYWVTTKSTI